MDATLNLFLDPVENLRDPNMRRKASTPHQQLCRFFLLSFFSLILRFQLFQSSTSTVQSTLHLPSNDDREVSFGFVFFIFGISVIFPINLKFSIPLFLDSKTQTMRFTSIASTTTRRRRPKTALDMFLHCRPCCSSTMTAMSLRRRALPLSSSTCINNGAEQTTTRHHHNHHLRPASLSPCSPSLLLSSSQPLTTMITSSLQHHSYAGMIPFSVSRRWHSSAAAVEDNSNDPNMTTTTSSNRTPFLLADIGEGIAEVELLQWFVEEGDNVRQFDRICEVQSDKATVEITSRYDGVIVSLEHQIGDMVKVGSPLLFLQGDGNDGDGQYDDNNNKEEAGDIFMLEEDQHKGQVGGEHQEQQSSEPMLRIPTIASQYHLQSDDDGFGGARDISSDSDDIRHRVQTTPAIRKLAKEYNLDLSTIVGTGPQGRVLKGDVLTLLRERGLIVAPRPPVKESVAVASSSPASVASAAITSPATPSFIKDINEVAGRPLTQDATLEIRGYNRLMVQSMTQSLQIPTMVFADEIQIGNLVRNREDLPFLPFAIKAMSQSLIRYPILNSSFTDDSKVTLWKNHNIGIAMDTPRGLIVPVIKYCQNKSISEIADDLKRLKALAQDSEGGGVPAEDLQGATITLSNIGAIGVGTYMSPIVTSPQVAIAAIGAIQRLPRFVAVGSQKEVIEEVHICNISWGGDHRVIDGATMARFHKQWKDYMENPMKLIQDLK